MKLQKHQKLQVSQVNDRIPTCLITKGWRKTTWVKLSTRPVASTNEFLSEDVAQVVKKIQRIESTSDKSNRQNNAVIFCLDWPLLTTAICDPVHFPSP